MFKISVYSSIRKTLSSTSTRASKAKSSTSLTVLNTSFFSNSTPTIAISNFSIRTTFTKSAKATFTSTVVGSHGFSGIGISARLTTLGKALVGSSIGQGDWWCAIVQGLSGGHSHEKEKDSLFQNTKNI